jgi:ribonuclease E
MPKQIIIAEQNRIGAVFSEDQIQEIIVSTGQHQVCDIYLGVVENILQGIDAAFVNIGDPSRNGFIHVTDLGPLRLRRSAGAITDLLAPQQKVLTQIMKEPTGNKGPRLTGNISLPGRYVVLMPYGKGVNLSRRVSSEAERNRLRALAVLIKPAGMGLLVRTEAEGKAEEAIIEDLEQLQRQWETVQQDATSTRAPALLYRDDDFIQRVLRDTYTSEVNRIVVDSPHGIKRVKQYLVGWSGGRVPDGVFIDHHRERQPILEYFRVNAAIKEALKPRVDLPSGGYIIIEPTEALTVIDVNSGSFTRSNSSRETVLWTNCEAATEIARQLRLRNLAGVIVVDFIDMDYRKDKLQVLEHFDRQLRADKARPQISQLSELGLVELTRKRQGQNIYELFGQTCSHCGGLGHVVQLPGEAAQSLHNPDRFDRGDRERLVVPSPEVPVVQRSWDQGNEPFDQFGEEDDNLVNHPSYQERSRLDKKRRRRNDRTDETPVREREETERPVPRAAAMAVASPPPVVDEQPPAVDVEQQPSKAPQSKPTRAPVEPPERLAVAMSDLEKDAYAWMGVSPLIKLEQEVRNPRTAIVTIVPLGTLPEPAPEPEPELVAETLLVDATETLGLAEPIPQPVVFDYVEEPVVENVPALPVVMPEVVVPAAVVVAEEEEDPSPELAARRRRRRSSATVD